MMRFGIKFQPELFDYIFLVLLIVKNKRHEEKVEKRYIPTHIAGQRQTALVGVFLSYQTLLL